MKPLTPSQASEHDSSPFHRWIILPLVLGLMVVSSACGALSEDGPLGQAVGDGSESTTGYPGPDGIYRLYLPIVYTEQPAYPGPGETTEGCDLTAVFTAPFEREQPGGVPLGLSVRFGNIGSDACPENEIKLLRYRGSTGAGFPIEIGVAQYLPPLEPGDEAELDWLDEDTPLTGTVVYRIDYQAPHSDVDDSNHQPEKIVTFVTETGDIPPPIRKDDCDLEARFTRPQADRLPGGEPVTWEVTFTNLGDKRCDENNISLDRFSGQTATGVATRIGGSGGFEALPALRGGDSETLRWRENNTPQTGFYTYKIKYASPHNDVDNFNHYPEKTVEYVRDVEPTRPGAECDLEARFIGPEGDTLPGGEPVNWEVRFRNLGQAACKNNRIEMLRYRGDRASGSSVPIPGAGISKSLPPLNPGGAVTLLWREIGTPETSDYTYAIRYQTPHSDANNRNHDPEKTVTFKSGGGNPECNVKGCDLRAVITAPRDTQQPGGEPLEFRAEFKNIGNQNCPGNKINLYQYAGRFATGQRQQVGSQSLQPLAPCQTATISWSIDTPDKSTFTYRVEHANPAAGNDADNSNHNPLKTIQYSTSGGGGGGSASECDIEAKITQPRSSTLDYGRSNSWAITFENLGDKRCSSQSATFYRYSGSRASGQRSKETTISMPALDGGKRTTRDFGVSSGGLAPGKYTYQLDFGSRFNDGNSRNHSPEKTVDYQPQGCELALELSSPRDDRLPGGQTQIWDLRVRNIGKKECPSGSVSASFAEKGSRSSRNLGSDDYDRVRPGATQSVSFKVESPKEGAWTYDFRISRGDEYSGNNRVSREVSFR